MHLLTGPPGSGKSYRVLQELRAALRRQDAGVRLLVPTATMAQHLRHSLAREGIVFRPNTIQTLHRFVEPWVGDLPQISAPALDLLVEQAVLRVNAPAFAQVAHLAGFRARLASVMDECSAAGVDARALEPFAGEMPLGEPLAAVFAEIERMLAERRFGLRAARLLLAASRIGDGGTCPIQTFWLDGFFSLTDPELSLVRAVAKHAAVTVTLPSAEIAAPSRKRLIDMGFREHVLERERAHPERALFVAPTLEREADEICRRILEEHTAGRLFREMGVIVRNPDVYVPVLRATLERFGIPARFYFTSNLEEQAAVRYLIGAVDAMAGGWDHAQTLATMRLAPGVGISAAMDRFDFRIREQLPRTGLETLRRVADEGSPGDRRVLRLIERFTELDGWRALRLKPAQWLEQFSRLRALYRPSRPADGVARAAAIAWRSQQAALAAFEEATGEAAQFLETERRVSLEEFWGRVKAVVRGASLRVPDDRRDTVHVMSAYEARQWELPTVFVCGLVEGQFPAYHAQDPLLPDHARRRLKQSGFRLRTAEDAEIEERFLFDWAVSRTTRLLVLSYPRNDSRGEQNLRSLFLDPSEKASEARPVRVQSPPAAPAPAQGIRSEKLLRVIQTKHAAVRPTALENYLQCPFQFFGRHTLKLKAAPVRPDERLDFLVRGTIVHSVIREWLTTHEPVEEIFERLFREKAEASAIPPGYRTHVIRELMLADLRRFTETDPWPVDWSSRTEQECKFHLDNGLEINGRIDRLIETEDGRGFVVDYKYSRILKERVTDENLLQGPLYWLAIERAFHLQPAGMYYCTLREGVEYGGWGEPLEFARATRFLPFAKDWLDAGVARSVDAANQINSGRTAPAPADLAKCRYCEYKDVCRFEAAAGQVMAEEA